MAGSQAPTERSVKSPPETSGRTAAGLPTTAKPDGGRNANIATMRETDGGAVTAQSLFNCCCGRRLAVNSRLKPGLKSCVESTFLRWSPNVTRCADLGK